MYIFYNIWYEHGPFSCSANTLGEPRKRRFYSYIFLQRTHLYVFQIFSWKELEKGGTVSAINAYFTLQISLKQQLAVVLTKATLSQEKVLSRNDWDLKIQFSDNFESSQRAENTSLCGAEEQSQSRGNLTMGRIDFDVCEFSRPQRCTLFRHELLQARCELVHQGTPAASLSIISCDIMLWKYLHTVLSVRSYRVH